MAALGKCMQRTNTKELEDNAGTRTMGIKEIGLEIRKRCPEAERRGAATASPRDRQAEVPASFRRERDPFTKGIRPYTGVWMQRPHKAVLSTSAHAAPRVCNNMEARFD